MSTTLKTTLVALAAALALTAMTASAAQAAEAHFTAEPGTTKITGMSPEFNQKLTTTAGSVECTGHFVNLNPAETSSTLTVIAKYEPCKAFFGTTPKVEMHSCHYTFQAGAYGSGGSDTSVGTADIACTTAGDTIVINAPGCVITIGPQTKIGPIHYETNSNGGVTDITVTPVVTNISYSHHGFLCGTGSGTTGTYSGPVTINGTDSDGNPTNISITST